MIRSMYRTALGVLPSPLATGIRSIVGRLVQAPTPTAALTNNRVVGEPAQFCDPKNPFAFVGPEALQAMEQELKHDRQQLLQVRSVRATLARERAKHLMSQDKVRRVQQTSRHVVYNTLDYNLDGAKTAADFDRPSTMTSVVSGIERVRMNAAAMDVLSIGPRSEIEIFALLAAGFSRDRIRAVDLFSYSPYVEIGDMHKLPYPDDSFDIVFLGWVLAYSRDQAVVAREITRICRNRAIVVVAGDYNDGSRGAETFRNELTFMQSCDQILGLFAGKVGPVYFRHDPEPPKTQMVMTVFEVKKP